MQLEATFWGMAGKKSISDTEDRSESWIAEQVEVKEGNFSISEMSKSLLMFAREKINTEMNHILKNKNYPSLFVTSHQTKNSLHQA